MHRRARRDARWRHLTIAPDDKSKVQFISGYAANAAVGAGHLDAGIEVLVKSFNTVEQQQRVDAVMTST